MLLRAEDDDAGCSLPQQVGAALSPAAPRAQRQVAPSGAGKLRGSASTGHGAGGWTVWVLPGSAEFSVRLWENLLACLFLLTSFAFYLG